MSSGWSRQSKKIWKEVMLLMFFSIMMFCTKIWLCVVSVHSYMVAGLTYFTNCLLFNIYRKIFHNLVKAWVCNRVCKLNLFEFLLQCSCIFNCFVLLFVDLIIVCEAIMSEAATLVFIDIGMLDLPFTLVK